MVPQSQLVSILPYNPCALLHEGYASFTTGDVGVYAIGFGTKVKMSAEQSSPIQVFSAGNGSADSTPMANNTSKMVLLSTIAVNGFDTSSITFELIAPDLGDSGSSGIFYGYNSVSLASGIVNPNSPFGQSSIWHIDLQTGYNELASGYYALAVNIATEIPADCTAHVSMRLYVNFRSTPPGEEGGGRGGK